MNPFLNWPGGKRWLVPSLSSFINADYRCYIEPFVGSGTLFFYLEPSNAILADKNARLIETYSSLKDNYRKVLHYLKIHDQNHSTSYYYEIRDRTYLSPYPRAAQFIYLNRTCFNGIYRVNLKGQFNVPIGTKKHVLRKDDDFSGWSHALKGVQLISQDYQNTISVAKKKDFIYADPPYTVQHNNNGFVKYNEQIFSWEDQKRLCECLSEANRRGARILISNADHESIWNLYGSSEWTIKRVNRFSGLAASTCNRKRITEILISN